MSINSGMSYRITNSKAGTVVDLSAMDNTSVIGWPYHSGSNQHWTLDWAGNGWHFRSLSTGKYLSLGGADAADGAALVGATEPFLWHIWTDDNVQGAFRIFVPNTYQNLDLYNYGNTTPGTPITTWYSWNGEHQTWRFDVV
ncbi:ricin B lectin domain-containing protein [Schizophyllum amplum]|uniref:Ricin B lectin domain-containing protein n=1 Tax=Schizophyllum amplum TaxID=97359 RepID=A0A550CPT3_9AGAR|nr:ricin B lectin domain-containing protein [Auriculariopsis ampla]